MKKKARGGDLPDFDPAEHLKDEADIAAYLALIIEEGDSSELAYALGVRLVGQPVAEYKSS